MISNKQSQLIETSPQNKILDENETDETLVQEVLNGDQNALATIITRYQVSVYNLCWRMLRNPDEAEDAAQEVFLRAYQQLHTYEPARKFSTWLFSIAAHHCIDLLRKKRPTLDLTQIMFWKTSQEPEPEELAVSGEERDEVRTLLKNLPEKYRQVIILKYWYDFSYDEIAAATGLTVPNVKTRLFRGRDLLAKELEQKQPGRPDSKSPKKPRASRNPLGKPKPALGGGIL